MDGWVGGTRVDWEGEGLTAGWMAMIRPMVIISLGDPMFHNGAEHDRPLRSDLQAPRFVLPQHPAPSFNSLNLLRSSLAARRLARSSAEETSQQHIVFECGWDGVERLELR